MDSKKIKEHKFYPVLHFAIVAAVLLAVKFLVYHFLPGINYVSMLVALILLNILLRVFNPNEEVFYEPEEVSSFKGGPMQLYRDIYSLNLFVYLLGFILPILSFKIPLIITLVGITISFLCCIRHKVFVDNVMKRIAGVPNINNPYLSGILVWNISRKDILESISNMSPVDEDNARDLLLGAMGENDWVISFPKGISLDTFVDVMLEISLDKELKEENSVRSDWKVVGYYQSLKGDFEGKMTMIRPSSTSELFSYVDSDGVNYIEKDIKKKKFIFFKKSYSIYVPSDTKPLEYEPVDLTEIIRKSQHIKRIKIDDSFDMI